LAEKHARGSQRLVAVFIQSEQSRELQCGPPWTPVKVNDVAAVFVLIKGNAELVHRRKFPCKKESLPSPKRSKERTGAGSRLPLPSVSRMSIPPTQPVVPPSQMPLDAQKCVSGFGEGIGFPEKTKPCGMCPAISGRNTCSEGVH
jgi:hypothetical protein